MRSFLGTISIIHLDKGGGVPMCPDCVFMSTD